MKKIFSALLFLLVATAQAFTPNPDFEFHFNRLPGLPPSVKYQFGSMVREAHNTAVCVYDFATSGGAVSTITLKSTDLKTSCSLPGKAVVRGGYIDVTTALTSGGSATVSVSTGKTAGDLHFADTYANYVTTGRLAVSPAFATVSTYIKLTNANTITNGVSVNAYNPSIAIAGAALTAGHFRVFIDYNISE